MKRFLAIIAGFFGLILLAMLIIPYFYKDNLLNMLKQQANKKLEAEVAFSNDIGLSLFPNFPDATLTINDISVVNKAPFKGDTLASVKQFSTTIDLFSLMGSGPMRVEAFSLKKPDLFVHVLKDGTANYQIYQADTTAQPEKTQAPQTADTAASSFQLALSRYTISNANVVYKDESTGIFTQVTNLDHEGSGDFTATQFNLDTKTDIQGVTFRYGGVQYMDAVRTQLDAILGMNLDKMKFSFKENTLRLNDFTVGFDGHVAMPSDAIAMDLSVKTKETAFSQLLSLVPAIYEQNFENLETRGKLTFQGEAKGQYTDKQYPAFNAKLMVENGYFKYPSLPKALRGINLDLAVANPNGDLDKTVTRLQPLRFQLGSEPFKASMVLKTPMSDPFVDGAIKGKLNLGNLQELIPLGEETKLAGVLDADAAMKGHYSAIEASRYEDFKAEGNLSLSNFRYASAGLAPMEIPEARLSLSPQKAALKAFRFKTGKSDLKAQGTLNNMLGYVMKGKTLKGQFTVQSDYLNLNPLLASEEGEPTQETEQPAKPDTGGSYQLQAPAIPANLDLSLQADQLDHLVYTTMDMRNIRGEIGVRDQALYLSDFSMNMLDGQMTASGQYNTRDPQQPKTNMNLAIEGFDIQKANKTFTTLQKYAPVAEHAYGDFDADLAFKAPFQPDLMPIYDSIYSKGSLTVDKATIRDHKVLNKVADALKDDSYRELTVRNINPKYIIENGQIRLREPLRFQTGDNKFRLDGSMGLDQELNYVLQANVPGGRLQQQASKLVSQFTGKDANLGNRILVDFVITGQPGNPKIKPKFAGTAGGSGDGGADPVKQAKEKLQQQKQKAKQKVKEKKKELKQKAEKEKEKAKEKAKDKAKKAKEKAKEKAKDKVKDIFK